MNTTDRISEWLSLSDCIKSEYAQRNGIANLPANHEIVQNLMALGKAVYDPVCEHFKMKIPITSGYRNNAVNKGIGGSKTSQHVQGQALDLDPDGRNGVSNAELFRYIRSELDFDQLIAEYGTDQNPAWVHVSFVTHRKNRKQVLRKRYGQPYENYK
jgi:zinc D-Ala-D-Ala carboxypeptidase